MIYAAILYASLSLWLVIDAKNEKIEVNWRDFVSLVVICAVISFSLGWLT